MDHTSYVAMQEEIERLKRLKDHAAAVSLLWKLVAQTESDVQNEQRDGVESWPYQQLAIVYRKERDYTSEVAIIERFASLPHSHSKQGKQLVQRLAKAYELAGLVQEDGGILYHIGEGVPIDEASVFRGLAAFIDTETTGMSGNDELIELAIVLFQFSHLSGRNLRVVESYAGLRQPGCKIHPAAKKKHGITEAQVRGKELENQRVMNLLGSAEILVSHNASFDRRFVSTLFPMVAGKAWYCSMNGVKWSSKGFGSKGLQNLLADHGLNPDRSHRALDDVHSALTLLSQTDRTTGTPYFMELLQSYPLRPPREESDLNSDSALIITVRLDIREEPKPGLLQRLMFWRR